VKNGVADGDKLVAVNGTQTPDWRKTFSVMNETPSGSDIKITISHDGVSRDVALSGVEVKAAEHLLGYQPEPAVISDPSGGMPAKQAGLKEGDLVTAVNGVSVHNWQQCVDMIRKSGGNVLKLDVQRAGRPLKFEIHPVQDKDENGQVAWKIGVGNKPEWSFESMTFAASVKRASTETVEATQGLLGVLGKLFTGKLSVRQLQGFVGIAVRAGQAVQSGPVDTVLLMAMISLNLGILNLLPIPILDGGHILLLSIEGIRRRDLSLAFKERFIQVGFVFLLLLFAFVMYNDVRHLLPMHT
jgi:regulator of sigma E protease